MSTKIRDSGGEEADGVLDSALVLALNSRVTKLGGSAEDSGRVGGTRAVSASPGGTVALPTLRDEERELLSLVDGQRAVDELVRLSTMSAPVVHKHLRSLRERGILIELASGGTSEPEGARRAVAETDAAPFAADGPSALTKAIDDYLELAATTLTSAAMAEEESRRNVTAPASPSGAEPARQVDADSSGGAPPGTDATRAHEQQPPQPSQPNLERKSPEPAAAKPSQQAFRPNVTAFWTPAMTADALANAPQAAKESTFSSADGVAPDASPASSSGPTVVVKGSPPAPDTPGASGRQPVGSEGGQRASASPAVSAPIPFRVGAYEVATRIAQGGMGSIYVCRRAGDSGLGKLFTLKVVRQYSGQREEAIRSFKREAHVGSLLGHPNLQTVLDVGSYKDQPFLILDYIEGTSLSDLVADEGRVPPRVVVAILLDVLRGLERAHTAADVNGTRLGLVHGDVSPQNVLVGVDGVARLTDFGSATFTGEGKDVDPKRVVTGKPAYMAPEQLRAEPLDARTDVFSTGVLMWNALTGQKLFASETYDETIVKVLKKKIPPPSTFGSPACLDEICLKALSRSKEGRYATADEMARELFRVASNEDLIASVTEVGQWVRRESGDALGELRRRIQSMFPNKKAPSGHANASMSAGRVNTPMSAGRVNTPMSAGRVNTPMSPGRVSTPFAPRPAAATVVLDAQKNMPTPRLGASKALPSRTIFLQAGPRKTFWRTWNVVIVSALLALPVTLTIGYFVSNLLLARPQSLSARPSNLTDAASTH